LRTKQVPLDDVGGLGIFNLLAQALAVLPWERERAERDAAAAIARRPRPGLLDRLDGWFWRHKQRALDGHLSRAKDVYELEARIRNLERSRFSRYYY
jgi:hypothetical protein